MNSAWKFAILACVLVGAVFADNHGGDHDGDMANTNSTDGGLACLTECVMTGDMPTSAEGFTKEVCESVMEYVDCLDTKDVCKDDPKTPDIKKQVMDSTRDGCKEYVGEGSGCSIAQASVLLTAVAALFARW